MDVTLLIFIICYVSPLENMSLLKFLIVSPLYMIMTVLTMVYGAVAIASDCAKFTLEVPHYFLLYLLHCCYFVAIMCKCQLQKVKYISLHGACVGHPHFRIYFVH